MFYMYPKLWQLFQSDDNTSCYYNHRSKIYIENVSDIVSDIFLHNWHFLQNRFHCQHNFQIRCMKLQSNSWRNLNWNQLIWFEKSIPMLFKKNFEICSKIWSPYHVQVNWSSKWIVDWKWIVYIIFGLARPQPTLADQLDFFQFTFIFHLLCTYMIWP